MAASTFFTLIALVPLGKSSCHAGRSFFFQSPQQSLDHLPTTADTVTPRGKHAFSSFWSTGFQFCVTVLDLVLEAYCRTT